ncbi:MAG: integrase arm-type DNA-binding domain-containing protein, partial [Methylobacter sp.]
MATLKLTDRLASNLPANDITSKSKAKEYGDQQVPGLKLAVGKSFGKPPHKSWLFRGTLNGTKICVQLGSFLTTNVAEARAKALQCKSSIENGIDPRVKPTVEACPVLTFVELSKQYMEWARQAKRSAKSDESKLKHHLLKRWGDRDIASITRRDIESYHLEIISQLSPATGNRHLSLVSQMFAKAKDWGLIDNNPA